jgi:hypothetical protein
MNIRSILLVVAFAALTIYAFRLNNSTPIVEVGNRYEHSASGIAFNYPDGYVLTEEEVGNGEREQYAITLIREEDNISHENSEGPTAITVVLYQNNIDEYTLLEWLTETNDSNFKLSSGDYESVTVAGQEAVRYRWSGLYEGETVAFLHRDNVVAISVMAITPEDENRRVFEGVLSSLTLN